MVIAKLHFMRAELYSNVCGVCVVCVRVWCECIIRNQRENIELGQFNKNLPSQRMAWLTSKGHFMSPSTRPGVSTNVTRLNFFCFDVLISVVR